MVSGFPYPTIPQGQSQGSGGKVGRPRMSRGPTRRKIKDDEYDSDFEEGDDGEGSRGQGLGFSPTIQYVHLPLSIPTF